VGSYEIEAMLDTVALFALLVAALQVISLLTLYRIAHHLEPWPPRSFEASSSA
jgi:hypothetical protein